MLTEQVAKNKYCPLVPLAQPPMFIQGGGMSVMSSGPAVPMRQFNCQGSACMMWRHGVVDPECYDEGNAPGYCGLAGRPVDE